MSLRRIAWLILATGCDNAPGEVRVINMYTGPCPLAMKTSVSESPDGLEPWVPLGAEGSAELRAGLVRVDLQTQGIACGAEPCTLGPAGFVWSCAVYTAGGWPAEVTVRNIMLNGCEQPEVVCPEVVVDAGQ